VRLWLFWLLISGPSALAALGTGLLAFSAQALGHEVVSGLRRRLNRRIVLTTVGGTASVAWGQRRLVLKPADALPAMGGLALAVLWRAPLLSIWSLMVGLAATTIVRASRPQVTAERRSEQELFLSALRSRYAVEQSLTAALDGAAADLADADGPPSEARPLVRAVHEAVRRLRIGETLEQALQPLASQGQTLRRLVTVLAKAPWSAAAETQVLLGELEESARGHRRLADRARVTLSVVRLTLWILLGANVAAGTVAALIPAWRDHYVAHPATYLVGTGLALAGFAYFAFKIKALEERL
jgi:hypothetical protein